MGRRKISMNQIQDSKLRKITFHKRKNGLVRKAAELSLLCGVNLLLIFEDSNGTLVQYSRNKIHSLSDFLKTCKYRQVLELTSADYPNFFSKSLPAEEDLKEAKPKSEKAETKKVSTKGRTHSELYSDWQETASTEMSSLFTSVEPEDSTTPTISPKSEHVPLKPQKRVKTGVRVSEYQKQQKKLPKINLSDSVKAEHTTDSSVPIPSQITPTAIPQQLNPVPMCGFNLDFISYPSYPEIANDMFEKSFQGIKNIMGNQGTKPLDSRIASKEDLSSPLMQKSPLFYQRKFDYKEADLAQLDKGRTTPLFPGVQDRDLNVGEYLSSANLFNFDQPLEFSSYNARFETGMNNFGGFD